MLEGLRRAAAAGVAPWAIGIDTWGVDFALLDEQDRLLENPRCYRDPRNLGISRWIAEQIGPDRLQERTGSMFQDHASLCQLYAAKIHTPHILDKARKLVFIPDLLRLWLCGNGDADITFASTSQMYDVPRHKWATEILNELGLPSAILPQVHVGPKIAGTLGDELCRQTGIGPVPVVMGAGHDSGSTFGVCRGVMPDEDMVVISSGTWSILGIYTAHHLSPGTLDPQRFGYEANPDGSLRIIRNLPGSWLIERCRDVWQGQGADVSYAAIIAAARAAAGKPGASAILDTSWEGFVHPENMCQAIAEHCRQSGQAAPTEVGEVAHVVFASLAESYAKAITDLRTKTLWPLGNVYICGGMSQNQYVNELTEQRAHAKVTAGPIEATALGNVAMQMAALGRKG